MNKDLIYPRAFDKQTAYLKNVINSKNIIVGGVPAKQIRKRFDDATIQILEDIKWWN